MSGYVEAATLVVNTIGGAVKILENNRTSTDANQVVATAMPRAMDPMSSPAQGTNTLTKWYVQSWDFLGEGYVSQCKINIRWAYGSRFNGGGAFIPSITAWVTNIDVPEMWVPWSHDLDITFIPGSPYTQDAGGGAIYSCLPLTINLTEATTVDRAEDNWQFTLYGNGSWQEG
ncbi:MAG: hypothetical protein H0W25_10990 [Acidimicrobiia bacterium]|nr:hypothetical protein [Acidimicrobiia bacterium]